MLFTTALLKIHEPTLSSGPNRQNYPFHDKLQTTQYNSGMILPHSPYPWYPTSLICKTPEVPTQRLKSSHPTSTEPTCSETISVPETKPIEPDPIPINSPNKSETSTNEVHIDVVHIESITAKKDDNNPSSDAKNRMDRVWIVWLQAQTIPSYLIWILIL